MSRRVGVPPAHAPTGLLSLQIPEQVEFWVGQAQERAVQADRQWPLSDSLWELRHEFRVSSRRAGDLADSLATVGYEVRVSRRVFTASVTAVTRAVIDRSRLGNVGEMFDTLLRMAQRHHAHYLGWDRHLVTRFTW